MAQAVHLPPMGESLTSATIVAWLKKVGQEVRRDEPLFEMSSDKVDAEIPSPHAGVLLEIKVAPGQEAAVGAVVATIGTAQEFQAQNLSALTAPQNAPQSLNPKQTKLRLTPVAQNLATTLNIDVTNLFGSGPDGRITRADVLKASQNSAIRPPGVPGGGFLPDLTKAPDGLPKPPESSPRATTPSVLSVSSQTGARLEPLSVMRTKIAEHLLFSQQHSAHVTTTWELCFDRASIAIDKQLKTWPEQNKALAMEACAVWACVQALNSHPVLNSSLHQNQIYFHPEVHLGLVVSISDGVIVPVIHSAQKLTVLELAERIYSLRLRARTKKLTPQDVSEGTFTVMLPEQSEALFVNPIIHQPQIAIFSLGKIEKRPVVKDESIIIKTQAYATLTFDHRLIDNSQADFFMNLVKKNLDEFETR